jgi:hypothetical protein
MVGNQLERRVRHLRAPALRAQETGDGDPVAAVHPAHHVGTVEPGDQERAARVGLQRHLDERQPLAANPLGDDAPDRAGHRHQVPVTNRERAVARIDEPVHPCRQVEQEVGDRVQAEALQLPGADLADARDVAQGRVHGDRRTQSHRRPRHVGS